MPPHKLRELIGILSSESTEKLKRVIKEIRRRDNKVHERRVRKIVKAFNEL